MKTIDYAMRVAIQLQNENKLEPAKIILNSILEAQPQHAHALHLLGILAHQAGNTALGIELIQQAIASNASIAVFYSNLCEMYRQLKEINFSIQYGQQAILLDPNSAIALSNLGIAYYDAKQYELAENYHQRALAIHPQLAASLNNMASINISKASMLMEMGDISQAEKLFTQVATDSVLDHRVLGLYGLVQLQKIKSNDPNLQSLLKIANNAQDVSPSNQEYLYFALGKAHDDIGEWEKAFLYFHQGCNLKRKRINYNITDDIELTQKLIQTFTHEAVEHLRAFADPSSLPIFIVGMPRSGTTLVEQILASHPDVHGAGELPYFYDLTRTHYPENIFKLLPENYRHITQQFLLYLKNISADAKHITDKMPQNFMTIPLIHALFPNAKIIHMRRNPIDTCLSCYTKLFHDGQLYSYDLIELGLYYNCYNQLMSHWKKLLPANAWLNINYENIVDNLENESKRLIAYCGLAWNDACLTFYQSKRPIRTASFMQVRQPIYASSINRWQRFENELAPLIKILNQNTHDIL